MEVLEGYPGSRVAAVAAAIGMRCGSAPAAEETVEGRRALSAPSSSDGGVVAAVEVADPVVLA